MNKKWNRILFILAAILLNEVSAQAQLQLAPLEKAAVSKSSSQSLRTLADEPLQLPFWDDFTFTRISPSDSLWFNSQNVTITNSLAVQPPSFNTATFDGIDSTGRPYSQDINLSGESDNLYSRIIDLGPDALSQAEQSSVYFSFYWQLQGRGERPDHQDSLKLFFLDSDSVWQQIWSEGGRPEIDSAAFKQEIFSLAQKGTELDANFFHDNFRFKFTSYNRMSGMYDLWHVDYVYLDKNRNANDLYYQDRTISEVTPSLFYPYTALPISQFFAAPEKYTNPTFEFTVFSMEPPGAPDVIPYRIVSYDAAGNVVANFNSVDPRIQNLLGQEYWVERHEGIPLEDLQPYENQDSLYLSTIVTLTTEDDENRPFLFQNDTIVILNVLHDYFAYDDGTAEYAMEVGGGRGLRIAYEFNLEVQDTLTHIDLYLPYYRNGAAGQLVDLKIWKRLNLYEGERDSLVYTQRDVALTNSPGLNEFSSYELAMPVVLEPGTFYVGFEKRSDSFLPIGFDRNTNSRDKVYVSTDLETWFAGQEEEGSLMIRPRFSRVADPNVLSSRDYKLSFPVKVYPNPSNGYFTIEAESEAKAVQVFNLQGQLISSFQLQPGGNRKQISLQALPEGFYLLKLIFKNGTSTKKIFIKN